MLGSDFSGNELTTGAALYAEADSTEIESSLFSDNAPSDPASSGSAIYLIADGGSDRGQATIRNSTITGNSGGMMGGGVISLHTNLDLESSTISGNSSGAAATLAYSGSGLLQIQGTSTLTNSIVSGNTPKDLSALRNFAAPGQSPQDYSGFIEGSYSLVGTSGAGPFENVAATTTNIVTTEPELGPLADNGGPLRTMLPADDSPVVDKGLSTSIFDQRTLTRTIDFDFIPNAVGGNGTDIGAVELQKVAPPPPPPPTCETDPSLCPVPPLPSNNFTFGKLKLNKKKGTATLQVTVPGAGQVLLLGSKTVAKSAKTAARFGAVELKVKAKGKVAKTLKKKGKARLKVRVSFTPKGGVTKTKAKTVKLVKQKSKKRTGRK